MKIGDRRILVTGGAGFIGGHLVEALSKRSPSIIVVVDNLYLRTIEKQPKNIDFLSKVDCNLQFYEEDASNYKRMSEIIKENKIDTVFNLAILPLPLALQKPKLVFDTNVKIASVICELLRKDLFKTLVHFSSSEVYGSAQYVPMDEDHPLKPSTAYGASKASQDLLILSHYNMYGGDVRIIRPFNNYGPRQNDGTYSAVIPKTIRRIINGLPPEIYGDGAQTRDYMYVKDTCEAAIELTENASLKGLVVNVASGTETTIKELILTICELMDYNGKIIYSSPRPGDIRRHFADTKKMVNLLKFKPKTSLREGLRETIKWYLNK